MTISSYFSSSGDEKEEQENIKEFESLEKNPKIELKIPVI